MIGKTNAIARLSSGGNNNQLKNSGILSTNIIRTEECPTNTDYPENTLWIKNSCCGDITSCYFSPVAAQHGHKGNGLLWIQFATQGKTNAACSIIPGEGPLIDILEISYCKTPDSLYSNISSNENVKILLKKDNDEKQWTEIFPTENQTGKYYIIKDGEFYSDNATISPDSNEGKIIGTPNYYQAGGYNCYSLYIISSKPLKLKDKYTKIYLKLGQVYNNAPNEDSYYPGLNISTDLPNVEINNLNGYKIVDKASYGVVNGSQHYIQKEAGSIIKLNIPSNLSSDTNYYVNLICCGGYWFSESNYNPDTCHSGFLQIYDFWLE